MSNENESKVNEEKNENNENMEKSIHTEDNQNKINKSISYTQCPELKFSLISNIKNFKSPLSIDKSSLNFIKSTNAENKPKKVIIPFTNTSIFIGGGLNLKAMRIHLSNNFKYNNTVHKEISNFKNSKNKSVDKTNVRLSENKLPVQKVNIDLSENKKDELSEAEALKIIALRWKNNLKKNLNSLSVISNNVNHDTITVDKKKYLNDLVTKINNNSNNKNNSDNNKSNIQGSFILIKQDNHNKNNNIIYEIINPCSNEELEVNINNFIYKYNDNKENMNNISLETVPEQNYLNNGKKKSKFSSTKVNILKKNSISNNNNLMPKDDFVPIIILNKNDIKELHEIFEKHNDVKPKKNTKNNNYSIENITHFNILKAEDNNILRAKNQKNVQKNLDEINFNIFPVKVEKFEYINIVPNEIRTNYNIDVSNIALNQSDYMKQMKGGENEFDLLLNKNKEMEDFSQNTPISLLQEKYFIYAVSKWIKYCLPNPQSQLYIKYSYKTGHPLFDPIHLVMTNFTLWIERIETKRNDNRKGMISITSSGNYGNSLRNKANSKGKNINYSNKKKGYSNIYSNQINNSSGEKNQSSVKRNNSKTKLSK
jgi:hypothetical protein